MNNTPTTRTISALIALSVFIVAVISGLAVENSGTVVLTRALIALACGQALGFVVAITAQVAVREYWRDFAEQRPIDEGEMNELEARLASAP